MMQGSKAVRPFVAIALAGAATAAFAVEECNIEGKWINLNHGGMTANLTGLVRCQEDGSPTREIPYLNGKVHGVEKVFGSRRGMSNQTVHTEYRDGKRDGSRKTFDAKGSLLSDITFAGDRESGLARYYHPNGKVHREIRVAEADRESITHEYGPDGRLAGITCGRQTSMPIGRGACRYGDHTGTVETYWPSSAVRHRIPLKAGLIEGLFESRAEDGGVQRREELRGGMLDGRAVVFHPNGRPAQEAEFRAGVRHGPHKVFHDDGKLLEEITFEQGELVRERTFFLNGTLRAETQRTSGRIQARGFHDNGRLRYEAGFADTRRPRSSPETLAAFSPLRIERNRELRYNQWGAVRGHWPTNLRPDGLEKIYFETGLPAVETTFREGKRDGPARSWHENGKIAVETAFVSDRVTARREFDETGRLMKDEAYFEDGSRRQR